MSYQGIGTDLGVLRSATDFTVTGKHRFAVIDANANVAMQSVQGAHCDGVIQNNPPAGRAVTLRISGVTKFIAGAAFPKGSFVMSDANGAGVLATAGNKARIRALEAAVAAGQVCAGLMTYASV